MVVTKLSVGIYVLLRLNKSSWWPPSFRSDNFNIITSSPCVQFTISIAGANATRTRICFSRSLQTFYGVWTKRLESVITNWLTVTKYPFLKYQWMDLFSFTYTFCFPLWPTRLLLHMTRSNKVCVLRETKAANTSPTELTRQCLDLSRHSLLVNGFVIRVKRRVSHVEHELCTLRNNRAYPQICIVCLSSFYGYWLSLSYLQTFLEHISSTYILNLSLHISNLVSTMSGLCLTVWTAGTIYGMKVFF
jgi:hypothetical protein